MITELEAIKLLKKYKLNKKTINHCVWVWNIAYELSCKILNKNSVLKINPKKVKIAWILHDIWKCMDWIHELNTLKILKNEWLNKIASISVHWFLFEYFKEKWDINYEKYLPKTIENKILVLADMYYNQNQQKITINERFDDILNRYKEDKHFCKIVRIAKKRILLLEKELLKLM